MFCGLFAGLIWDSISANGHYFHAVTLSVTAFLVSYLVQRRIRNTVFAFLIVDGIVILLHNLIYWLIYVLVPCPDGAGIAFVKFYIPSLLITTAVGIIVFLAVRLMHNLFKKLP